MLRMFHALVALAAVAVGATDPAAARRDARVLAAQGEVGRAQLILATTFREATAPGARYDLALALGDLYYDKLRNFPRAESTYQWLIATFPDRRSLGDVYYRLGLAAEQQEHFIDAARAYEIVATRYSTSRFAPDALSAIERSFKKNYRDVVARVDSFPYTRLELDEMLAAMPEKRRAQYESTAAQRQLLERQIEDRLLLLEAERLDIGADSVAARLLADARQRIILSDLYRRGVVDRITVNLAEKKAYYKAHPADFTVPEQVRAREIRVASAALADSIAAELAAGTPFDSLAKKRSTAYSANRGGDMGNFARGRWGPEIDSVAFHLTPGQVSPPFKAGNEYVILKLEEKQPPTLREFAKVESSIDNILRQEKHDTLFAVFERELRAPHTIFVSMDTTRHDTLGRVDDFVITGAQFEQRLARIPPFARGDVQSPEGRARVINQIVLEWLMNQRAEEQFSWLADSVQQRLTDARRQVLLRQLYEREVTGKAAVGDSLVADYFQAHQADYVLPERARVRLIVVKTEAEADSLRPLVIARRGLFGTRFLARPARVAFDSLARVVSVDPSRNRGGDLGFLDRGGQSDNPSVDSVAFTLTRVGTVSRVFKTKQGFGFLRLEERRARTVRKLEDVRGEIEHVLRRQEQERLDKQLKARIQQGHEVKIYIGAAEEGTAPQGTPNRK